MYTCQCAGCQIGQSHGVLLKEVAALSADQCTADPCVRISVQQILVCGSVYSRSLCADQCTADPCVRISVQQILVC